MKSGVPTVRVLRIAPGAEPEVININVGLEAAQAVVGGGFIEQLHHEPSTEGDGRELIYFCNEDVAGLRPNRRFPSGVVYGTILVTVADEDGNDDDLTDAEIEQAKRTASGLPKATDQPPVPPN